MLAIAKTPYHIVEYPILEVIVRYNDGGREEKYLAMNECTIKSMEGTLVADVEIRGQLLKHSEEMVFVCLHHLAVQPIIRHLAGLLFIHPLGRSSWQKWLQSTTECLERSVRRSFCRTTIRV